MTVTFTHRLHRHNLSVPTALALPSIAIAIAGTQASAWLRYEREKILTGELWRLLTASFVHLGWSHLLMNLAALALIWMLFGRLLTTKAWLLLSLASLLSVGLGLLAFSPAIGWYVGLSGMLHGLFAAGILASLRAGHRLELALLALLVGKITWEQTHGPLPGTAEFAGGAVVTDAHFYGAIGGFMAGLANMLMKREG